MISVINYKLLLLKRYLPNAEQRAPDWDLLQQSGAYKPQGKLGLPALHPRKVEEGKSTK